MSIGSDEIIEAASGDSYRQITHIKTGRQYTVVDLCMFKIDDAWHNSVRYSNENRSWCRKFDDFGGFVFTDGKDK